MNISKLPLTHTGSVYLMPECSVTGIRGQLKFQDFINEWGNSSQYINFILGTIERGTNKGINHLQWVASTEDDLIEVTKKYLRPKSVITTSEKRRVKIANPNAVSGYSDTFQIVECTTLRNHNKQVSIENIMDKTAAALYVNKIANWGDNKVMFLRHQI